MAQALHHTVRTALDALGLRPDAGRAEIGPAFRRRALAVHPDVNDAPDARVQFDALLDAYEVALGALPTTGPAHRPDRRAAPAPRTAHPSGDVPGPPVVVGPVACSRTVGPPIVAGPPRVEGRH